MSVHKYIEFIVERVPLENLLPTKVMWINMQFLQILSLNIFLWLHVNAYFVLMDVFYN